MSDEKQPDSQPKPPFLSDDVTVGQLVRFINNQHMKAARANDRDAMVICHRRIESLESTLNEYRIEGGLKR
jgi:hypothetical protein